MEHGGYQVDCRADELFAVFPGAGGGVAAAVAMQRAVAVASWPDDGVVRVRVGLNVGDPVVADDVYVGLAVNRAARICSAGHGGQVLVSDSVRGVVGDAYEFRPLGSYTGQGRKGGLRLVGGIRRHGVLRAQRPAVWSERATAKLFARRYRLAAGRVQAGRRRVLVYHILGTTSDDHYYSKFNRSRHQYDLFKVSSPLPNQSATRSQAPNRRLELERCTSVLPLSFGVASWRVV